MAEPVVTLRVVKVPKLLMEGVDLKPYITRAQESIGQEIEKRQGRGLGKQRNTITRQAGVLEQRIFTTFHYPRRTGSAMQRHQEGRFRGMAPRAVKKYVTTPLEELWSQSVAQ